MQTIISDKYYDDAKKFIQDKVRDTMSSEESRNRLVKLYNSLTVDNSKEIYSKAFEIYSNEYKKQWRAFQISWLQRSCYVFLLALTIFIIGALGLQYTKKKSPLNSFFSTMSTFGIVIMLLSVIFGLCPWFGA
jgi:hypothetical protein